MKEKAASTNSMKDDLQKSADLMKETTQYVNEEKKIAIQMTQLRQIESSLLHAEDHPVCEMVMPLVISLLISWGSL